MGKTRGVHETTPELRNRMVGMYEAGLGLREIAAAVNCSQRTVKRWLNRFDKEGTVETRERCGRKRATTAEQDEAIVRLATQTPITAAKAVLPALGLTCSVDTIRERLHKAGIHNWSPSRKYMQRIPLGDTDGVTIQQPVWRPTGTQLGKKKSSKDSNKNEKNTSTTKKRNPSKKIRAKDIYVGDGAPIENEKSDEQREFIYHQQNASESQVNEMQSSSQPLQSQTEFGSTLSLSQQTQSIYQHPSLNISQNWPLDLVQGSHHYPQDQSNSISHEQVASSQQLQELHVQQEQNHVQQIQQTHNLDEQQRQLQAEVQHHSDQLHSQLASPQNSTNLTSDNSNIRGHQDNNQSSSIESNQSKDSSKEGSAKSEPQKKKKKGGKAKGTLETSVEIRNRMIGMSEAGLSTLSIALAIDRSERTVKRWLERWHKEGNVQTKERKGRRRITTKEQDEAIVAMATQQPLTAAKHVAPALGLKCSVDTIRERLHKAGIHSWKLGKKQGEGNAVHTVHLWQPSGNRPNKPKLLGEKKKKTNNNKKRDQMSNNTQKRPTRKRKTESIAMKMVSPSTNLISEQTTTLSYHNGTSSNIIQPIHNIPPPPPTIVQSQSHPPAGPPQATQSIQPMNSMIQQRPDCRLASIVAPVSGQGNTGVTYPSCMVGSNTHTGHMEQPDPLNYEPYIWSF
ncbi:AF4/FMR2 family member lilli-like isoform X2 [Apis laboriosa]|uniref:AF4/FMR2 family member lilli-like isoform X2 n=1 Tax=Apis laboriosa TaxID=183418 RepID=UPI001CC5A4C6|nr:AF4/FMR2 family member lilli-like isoform X2 [Apis laboriosa]